MRANIKDLYSEHNLHVGQILEQDKMDWATVAQSIQRMVEAANKKKGRIDTSLVLVCKREMADLLKSLKEDLVVIPDFASHAAAVQPKTLKCIVVDGDFPNHYIIVTDMEQWHYFMGNGLLPHRALIAMKGFKPEQKRVDVAYRHGPTQYDFLDVIRAYEFDGNLHNRLKNIVIHSDHMMILLGSWGLAQMGTLHGIADIHTAYDSEKASQADFHFENGLVVTLMSESALSRKKHLEKLNGEVDPGDITSASQGKFGS